MSGTEEPADPAADPVIPVAKAQANWITWSTPPDPVLGNDEPVSPEPVAAIGDPPRAGSKAAPAGPAAITNPPAIAVAAHTFFNALIIRTTLCAADFV